MGDWDKVEKKKRAATQADINKLYVSITLWILAGLAYFYFIIMGWHLQWERIKRSTQMQEKEIRVVYQIKKDTMKIGTKFLKNKIRTEPVYEYCVRKYQTCRIKQQE